jgi:uncharacterized protein (TIGR02246 family)
MSDPTHGVTVPTSADVVLQRAAEDLVAALCDAFDAKDPSAVGALFAPDGAFAAFGSPMIGPDAISAGMSHLTAAPDQRHVMTNVRSAVEDAAGGTVTVDAVFSVFHFTAAPWTPAIVMQTRTDCVRFGDRMVIARHSGRPLTAMPSPPGSA